MEPSSQTVLLKWELSTTPLKQLDLIYNEKRGGGGALKGDKHSRVGVFITHLPSVL